MSQEFTFVADDAHVKVGHQDDDALAAVRPAHADVVGIVLFFKRLNVVSAGSCVLIKDAVLGSQRGGGGVDRASLEKCEGIAERSNFPEGVRGISDTLKNDFGHL